MFDRVPIFGAFAEKLGWAWRVYSIPKPGTDRP